MTDDNLRAVADSKALIVDHATRVTPFEAVGLVLGNSSIYPLLNEADNPTRAFFVSNMQLAEAEDDIADLLGTFPVALYHSHPSGTSDLSPQDLVFAKFFPPESLLCVLAGDTLTVYATTPDGVEKVADL